MRVFIVIFCFLVIHEYLAADDFDEFSFDAIPLSHSGLLIFWKSDDLRQKKDPFEYPYTFNFKVYFKEDNTTTLMSSNVSHSCFTFEGQYKIHSLNESTLYEVFIDQTYTFSDNMILKTYSLKIRTNIKSRKTPSIPYFEIIRYQQWAAKSYSPHLFANTLLRWFPCGRQRICHNQESGTHFGIKIREPYSSRKLNEITREEFYKANIKMFIWPGILYEVVVYSINGERKTESDPQEIFLQPQFPVVPYVHLISLPDSSVLITWKPPKQSASATISHYFLIHFSSSDPKAYEECRIRFCSVDQDLVDGDGARSEQPQLRLWNITSEVTYTYSITPIGMGDETGLQYLNQFKLQSYKSDLQIAEPDFDYIIKNMNERFCGLNFLWLPCGKSFNCENTKPGTDFSFHFDPEPLGNAKMNEYGLHSCNFKMNVVYSIRVKSSIGDTFSESVTKKFKNCKLV